MQFKNFLLPAILLFVLSSCGSGKFRAAVKEDDKYGYIDENGKYVIDAKFQTAWSFIRGGAIVKENGKYGLIDKNGKYILQPQFDSVIPFNATCCIVEKDSVFGFMANGTGEILIKPQFEKVYSYTNELCVVQKGRALGIVNQNAKLVCPVIMQDFKDMFGPAAICIKSDTSDEVSMLLTLIQGGEASKKGLISNKGEVVLSPKYDEIYDDVTNGFYYSFNRAIDPAKDTITKVGDIDDPIEVGLYGILDTTGKIIAEPAFDELPVYGDGMFRVKISGKYGFADKNGKTIIQPAYEYAVAFSEGKAIVSIGSKASIIDKTGKILVENLGPGSGMYRFFNGLARCRSMDGQYGFLDEKGNRVIPPTLDIADDFENGRAIASIDNRYGLIDRTGKWIVPNEYDFFFNLGDGYYQIKDTEGKTGVVDSLGHVVLEPIYSEVFHLQKHFFTVEKDGLNGCYALSGKEIYPPVSARGIYFFNGKCQVTKNEKYGVIDTTGKFIIPLLYDSIGIFFKGYASVRMGKQFGVVDTTGKIILQPKYEELRPFYNGFAVYKEKGKYGYVDLTGKIIVDAKFQEATVFVDPDRKEFE